MIITISGKPGSGKTSVAEKLAKELGYKHVSVGNFQRQLAAEKGITVGEMMTLEKENPHLHQYVDKKTKELGETGNNLVIDGWIAYHFIPHSYKIFLEVSEEEAAKRIHHDSRSEEPSQETIKEEINIIKKRLEDSKLGFKKAHGINFLDPKNYDYILDTSNITMNHVVNNLKYKIQNEN